MKFPMPSVEVERKRALRSREVLERRLVDLGFVATGPTAEVDTYYSRPDIDFLETVECPRVRERDGGCEVICEPASDTTTRTAGGVIAKQETNVVLANADQTVHAHGLLEALGMVPLTRVEKSRSCCRAPRQPDLSVVVDAIAGLGCSSRSRSSRRVPGRRPCGGWRRPNGFWARGLTRRWLFPYRDLVLRGQAGTEADSLVDAPE